MVAWLRDARGRKVRPGEPLVRKDYTGQVDLEGGRVASDGGRSKGRVSLLEQANRELADGGWDPIRPEDLPDYLSRGPEQDPFALSYMMDHLPVTNRVTDPLFPESLARRASRFRHPVQPFAARTIQRAWKAHKREEERRSAAALSAMRGVPSRGLPRLPDELREDILSAGGFRHPDRIGLAGAGYQRKAARRRAPAKRVPTDAALYAACKRDAKRRFRSWPSARASQWLVAEYGRRGGRYRGGSSSSNLSRWQREAWKNLCAPGLPACGSGGRTQVCRPSKKVSRATPKPLAHEVPVATRRKLCAAKARRPRARLSFR